jgi:tetratricopeptide (TPR) repeat protein
MRYAKYSAALFTYLMLIAVSNAGAATLAEQTVSGTLVSPLGRFECNSCQVRVELSGPQPTLTTFPDANGNFNFFNVRRGSYTLRVIVDGSEEAAQEIDVFDQDMLSSNHRILVQQRFDYRRASSSNVVDVSQFLDAYPKKAVERYKRANESRKRNEIKDAVKYLEEAIRIAPNFYNAHNDLGLLYQTLGRFEDAEGQFLKAHEINESSSDPLVNLTALYIEQEKPDKAVETGEQAVKTNGRSPSAFFNLGLALYKLSQLDRAESVLKKALQLAPKMFQVRLMLANVYAKLRRYDRVLEQLDTYLAENPKGEERENVEEVRQKVLQAMNEVK